MRKYLLSFILLLWVSYGYSAALSPEEPLQMNGFNIPIKVSPSILLAVLETSRNQTELSDPLEFEARSFHIGSILGSPHVPSFSLEDEDSVHQALYSLIRLRQYYMGMPELISGFCLDYNGGRDHLHSNPEYLKRLQLLSVVDILTLRAFREEDCEEVWRTGVQTNSYTPDTLKILTEDLLELEPSLQFTEAKVAELLTAHLKFFEDAFHIYEIFAPRFLLRDLYSNLLVCGDSGVRGWTVEGLDAFHNWPDGHGLSQAEALNFMNLNFALRLDSVLDRGRILGERLVVDYNFTPVFLKDNIRPLRFRISKILDSSVKEFTRKFVYEEGPATSTIESRLLELDRRDSNLRRAVDDSNPQRRFGVFKELAGLRSLLGQRIYAFALLQGRDTPEDLPQARRHFKMMADRGESAQSKYPLMLREGAGGTRNIPESRRYFRLAADYGDKIAQFYYAGMWNDGESGLQSPEHARRYCTLGEC